MHSSIWINFQAEECLDYNRRLRYVPLDRNTYCLDSVTDKYTYTFCERDSLIAAVNGNATAPEIQSLPRHTGRRRLMWLSLWNCYSCHAWLSPYSVSHYWCPKAVPPKMLAGPRGDGADGKTRHLGPPSPDKLTSDGASCSALGACWAEQLSVEAEDVAKGARGLQTTTRTNKQSENEQASKALRGGKCLLQKHLLCYGCIQIVFSNKCAGL